MPLKVTSAMPVGPTLRELDAWLARHVRTLTPRCGRRFSPQDRTGGRRLGVELVPDLIETLLRHCPIRFFARSLAHAGPVLVSAPGVDQTNNRPDPWTAPGGPAGLDRRACRILRPALLRAPGLVVKASPAVGHLRLP